MINIANKLHSFFENLKDDFVGLDHTGTPISRASDEASAKVPGVVRVVTAADLAEPVEVIDTPNVTEPVLLEPETQTAASNNAAPVGTPLTSGLATTGTVGISQGATSVTPPADPAPADPAPADPAPADPAPADPAPNT